MAPKTKNLLFRRLTPAEYALFWRLTEFFEGKNSKDVFVAMLKKLESLYT